MTIRTRLAILVGVVMMAGGLTIGVTTAGVARDQALSRRDRVLVQALERVRREPGMDTSVLVSHADSSPVPISATLFFGSDRPIPIVEGVSGDTRVVVPSMSQSQIESTIGTVRRFPGQVLVRSLVLGEGEWVAVAVSVTDLDAQYRGSLWRSLGMSLLIAAVMVAMLWWVIRRTLAPVERVTVDATRIADGDLDVALEPVSGKGEIARLTDALTRMVDSLRGSLDVSARSERAMREFLGDASHELRTPLTVIRGYIDILDSGKELSPEQRHRAMSRLVGESQRMSGIIEDMLLLAELGQVTEAPLDAVDLSRVVDDHFDDLLMQQPSRRVDLRIQRGVSVRGNEEHLRRVVANIVANIARHTPVEAGVEVSLVADQSMAALTVDDTGPGLSVEMYERSKAGFQRFDKGRSAEGGGFGLGLSIVAAVVGTHRGSMEMSASPLGGLRTVISLPLA